MSGLILYTTEGGASRIQLRADGQTVWLTQLEMAELFAATKQNISLHLKNLLADGELAEESVVKESLTTARADKNCCIHARTLGLSREATVKESLTVASADVRQATAGKSSVVCPAGTWQARLGQ